MKISVKYFAGISVVAVAIGSGAVFAASAIAMLEYRISQVLRLHLPLKRRLRCLVLHHHHLVRSHIQLLKRSHLLCLIYMVVDLPGGLHQISSISYVRTTTNKALEALGPHAQGADHSTAPAWLIVAAGRFQNARGDVCQCIPPIYSDIGMVIVEGQPGVITSDSTKPYSLAGLGTVTILPKSQWAKNE